MSVRLYFLAGRSAESKRTSHVKKPKTKRVEDSSSSASSSTDQEATDTDDDASQEEDAQLRREEEACNKEEPQSFSDAAGSKLWPHEACPDLESKDFFKLLDLKGRKIVRVFGLRPGPGWVLGIIKGEASAAERKEGFNVKVDWKGPSGVGNGIRPTLLLKSEYLDTTDASMPANAVKGTWALLGHWDDEDTVQRWPYERAGATPRRQ